MRKTRHMRLSPRLNYFEIATPDPLGVIRYAPDGDPAAGGGGAGDPPPKPKDPPPEPKKLSMTEEEFREKTAKAVAKREKELLDQQAEKDRLAEEERKKKQGDFEALYKTETEKAKQIETEKAKLLADLRKRDVKDMLRDYVGDKHADYAGSVNWMWALIDPSVTPDLKDDDAKAKVKEIADQFVKDNPRATPRTGVPTPPRHGKTGNQDIPPTNDKKDVREQFAKTSMVANRF